MLTRIGVTGGIASGKSEACQQLKALGAEVLSADIIARQLTDTNPTIRKKIASLFGQGAYDDPSGLLIREFVAEQVFADPKRLQSLNAIVHPAVLERIDVELQAIEMKTSARYVAIEAALMFESGLNKKVDYVLAVLADEAVRISRSQIKNTLTEEQTRLRMELQISSEEIIERSDFVLYNNDSMDAFKKKVAFFHALFMTLKPRPEKDNDKN